MDLVLKKQIEIQETIKDDTICRVQDLIHDLECEVNVLCGWNVAANMIEHEMHYPKGYLHADVDEAEMHFDELAEESYAVAQKVILTALIRNNWLSEHEKFIKTQQRIWDDKRDEYEAEKKAQYQANIERWRAQQEVK